MTDMIKISLGALWDEAFGFVRSEVGLIAPVAFMGFGLPLVILELLMPQDLLQNPEAGVGPWALWLIPYALLSMVGTLAISALALQPGMSVREALTLAARRLPTGVGLVMIGVGGLLVLLVLLSIVAGIEAALTGGNTAGPVSLTLWLAMLAAIVWLMIRIVPVWAIIADRGLAPWTAAREAFRLTRGRYMQLLLMRVVAWVSQIIVMFVLLLPIAMMFDLIGRLTGAAEICQLLGLLASGAVVSAIIAIWTVYVSRLYRRLSATSVGI